MSSISLSSPLPATPLPDVKNTPAPGNVESAMKKAAARYYHISPFLDAAKSALTAGGGRIDKFDAGTAELANRLGMRFFNNWYQNLLQRQYDKHPAFARFVDNHPIMFGFPLIITTSALCSYAGDLTKQAFTKLYQKYLRSPVKSVLTSDVADRLLKPLGSVDNWVKAGMKQPWFKYLLGAVSMASSVAFVAHITLNNKLGKNQKADVAAAATVPTAELPKPIDAPQPDVLAAQA